MRILFLPILLAVIVGTISLAHSATVSIRGALSAYSYGFVAKTGGATCTPDAAVTAFLGRVATQDAKHQAAYCTLITSLEASPNVWATLDVLQVYAAAQQATAYTNLVSSSYGASSISTPTFTVDQGISGDGSTTGVDIGFNPTSAGGNYTQNSATIAVWDFIDNGSGIAAIQFGVRDASSLFSYFYLKDTDGNTYPAINDGDNVGIAVSTSKGFELTTRTGASSTIVYKDGVQIGTTTNSSAGLPNLDFNLCGVNNRGTFVGGGIGQYSIVAIGGTETSGQQLQLYNAVHAYLQTIAGIP